MVDYRIFNIFIFTFFIVSHKRPTPDLTCPDGRGYHMFIYTYIMAAQPNKLLFYIFRMCFTGPVYGIVRGSSMPVYSCLQPHTIVSACWIIVSLEIIPHLFIFKRLSYFCTPSQHLIFNYLKKRTYTKVISHGIILVDEMYICMFLWTSDKIISVV